MPRKEHEKRINELEARHKAALEKFNSLPPGSWNWWHWGPLTTIGQLELLAALVEQLEAVQAVAHAAAKNLNSALEVVVEANKET